MDPFVVSLGGAVLTALVGAVTALWRQSVNESRRKDELIDRLLDQANRSAEVGERTVSLVEKERTRR